MAKTNNKKKNSGSDVSLTVALIRLAIVVAIGLSPCLLI